MDYSDFFSSRLSSLRIQKGVSARDMSLSLGQSESYINKIENKKALPSMSGFFYICEYLGVTPSEFFTDSALSPETEHTLSSMILRLTPQQAAHIVEIIRDITDK